MHTTVFERGRPAASVVSHALTGTRQASFWLDDLAGATPTFPRLRGDLVADLVVVGGGYTGLWTALLAKRERPEARVVLLEAKTVGWAASGRNGGFCEASLTHGDENGTSRFPQEFDRLQELGLANLDEIETTLAEFGIDAEFERNGAIDLAVEPHQVEWLRESAGEHALFLDETAVRAQVNSPTYLAGVWHTRTSALVHPAKLAFGLAQAAVAAGVEIFENSRVLGLDTAGLSVAQGTDVRTATGTVRAVRTALATNVFPSLLKRNALQTVPVYDYALMTEPLSLDQLDAIGWANRQGLGDSANQFHYYRLSRDNRILFGGYDAIYHYGGRIRAEYENRPETFRTLGEHFFTTFPQLEGLRFSHQWAGAIDTCSRFCAFFGAARGGRIAYATGYTGLGVAATHFGAKVMLDLLAGRKTEITELEMVKSRPLPFPPEPLASLGIQATRWSLDRADHNRGERNLILKTLDAVGLGFDS
ncbi:MULTISPECIES: NAD(P)/FAD-dependent oxidoreductase [unclassified Leifsonia]|uniref:NAD(P)/FAD-dependent oxidoreductase n=1 Tax=unclassified Leifsonia TaxID=2663824 RepID=UPI0007011C7D|nr:MULTISPECIES: FAD-dependent oxidoreductase [unclassified Leifsonia]KQX05433.1 FAD-dependent oxidoreductase [Leifsonia sp. Root1293]KRA09066.1 FAD-dependent oxidoreductase [Leifsonia sp. Root60]